jgi:hypothetical protein
MTSSTYIGENINFSCMKAAYSQRSIEKAVSEGRISARDIALIKEVVNERKASTVYLPKYRTFS